MAPQQVTVVGSGMMGRGIAACVASGGHDVTLYDSNTKVLPSAVEAAEGFCKFLMDNGLPKGSTKKGKIKFAKTLEEACRGSFIVFEAVLEDMEVKKNVFSQIEGVCSPQVLFCVFLLF
tara:strand:- start:3141 stop:3497 length:357 start_codon:yes stop_codon:yes gene_type:complete